MSPRQTACVEPASGDLFADRADAGRRLAAALRLRYENSGALVLGIPRGGVEVAAHVARALAAEFSILVCRKLPFPDNPESGFGALAEDGSLYLMPAARRWLPPETLAAVVREQTAEIERRLRVLRQGRPLPTLAGRQVILVDDGIAMGSTMQAAILCCRNRQARRITVAAPVASPGALQFLDAARVDDIVVLLKPLRFQAVADYYAHWYDVSDEEVLAVVRQAREPMPLAACRT